MKRGLRDLAQFYWEYHSGLVILAVGSGGKGHTTLYVLLTYSLYVYILPLAFMASHSENLYFLP